jgi:hypothetical protein
VVPQPNRKSPHPARHHPVFAKHQSSHHQVLVDPAIAAPPTLWRELPRGVTYCLQSIDRLLVSFAG